MIALGWFRSLLVLAMVTGLAVVAAAADDLVTVKLSRQDDKVTVVAGKDEVIVRITSRSGIGQAEIQPVDKKWPAKLILEIDLKGLEGHSLAKGDLRMQGDGDTFRRVNGEWVRADNVGKEYHPKITNKDGKYTIEIPAIWLKAGAEPLTVEWIDFYRR